MRSGQRSRLPSTARRSFLLGLGILLAGSTSAQDPGPIRARMQALEAMIGASGETSLADFLDQQVAPELIQARGRNALLDLLAGIRTACAPAGGISVEPDPPMGARAQFETAEALAIVSFRLDPEAPHQIIELDMQRGPAPQALEAEVWTWGTVSTRLHDAAQEGFAGTVLLVRGGEVVLHQGYGYADRERQIPNTTRTLFAIGSTPIDFTKAAVLQLIDMGRLAATDPISEFFPGVPADKLAITIDQLMRGTSGLPNFHHIPGEDADYDLSWIDRDEAVERILGKELLFSPGEGQAHSHSAWTLLAAIVEIAAHMSYEEFLRKEFFDPLGMERTGLYPLARRFNAREVAVGQRPSPLEGRNTPAQWGPTSWLVMGSGGMVSTPEDLYRWTQGVYHGDLLSPGSRDRYQTHGLLAGGNDRGFLCEYVPGPENMMFLCSNSHTAMRDLASSVGQSLARLVLEGQ